MSSGQPNPSQPEQNPADIDREASASREEMLDSLLDQTRQAVDDEGYHKLLTEHVRAQRLSSKFDFENLAELVRCIVNRTRIDELPIDKEEAINWIATCFYEDPVACDRVELLWNSIVSRMHDHD
ncbi:MAG: hypothetical protein AAFN77_14720 [Planctomycetota bacterium]